VKIKSVVFWEPCASPHKHNLLSSLADFQPDVEVICCAQAGISEDRKSQGWCEVESINYKLLIAPDSGIIKSLVNDNIPETVHIFSGLRHVNIINKALELAITNKSRYFLMSEPRVFEGVSGYFRLLQSWFFERKVRKTTQGVFAIGANGRSWFKKALYPEEKIFDFAYYVDALSGQSEARVERNEVHVGYIGRLVPLKGVRYLVEAMRHVSIPAKLTIVGGGSELKRLKLKAGNNVSFIPSIPRHDVGKVMGLCDVLVLPSVSTSDGWGVVVSEALHSGCYVIATDKVGASMAIINSKLGCIVPSGDSIAISEAVVNAYDSALLGSDMRQYRKEFAGRCLTGDAGARWLWSVVRHRLNDSELSSGFLIDENT
jgi:glycosyltransferase involved in cell wall biosynthesis